MVPAAYLVNSVPVDVSTSVRDATTTLAPCAAKPRHIARPMPRLPPVTSATLSRNVIVIPCACWCYANVGMQGPILARRAPCVLRLTGTNRRCAMDQTEVAKNNVAAHTQRASSAYVPTLQ